MADLEVIELNFKGQLDSALETSVDCGDNGVACIGWYKGHRAQGQRSEFQGFAQRLASSTSEVNTEVIDMGLGGQYRGHGQYYGHQVQLQKSF